MTTLKEMPLPVGINVQLQLDRVTHVRLHAKLVGYLIDQAVIVTMPAMGGRPFDVIDGDAFICRMLFGRVALAFRANVIKVAVLPFRHLYLTYPKYVEAVEVRKALRLSIQQQVALRKGTAPAETQESAMLVDISMRGAGAVAKSEFAAVSDALVLLLPAQGGGAGVAIPVTVRRLRPLSAGADAATPQCHYGLEFGELGADGRAVVESLVQGQLATGIAF